MPEESISLARALSRLGYCSRSRAALYIKSGKVTVNGKVARIPSSHVYLDKDVIEIDKKRLSKPTQQVIMLNKPKGYVTTSSDELSRKTVYSLVPNDMHLFSIGRLDLDTTGLLLFTNNGTLQDKVASPDYKVSKTYLVTINGKIADDQVNRLLRGVEIAEGIMAKVDRCETFETDFSKTRLKIIIHEGKNREIRRMFESIGKKVVNLHRTAIGSLELDLPEGAWRKLSHVEIERLFK